MKNQTLLEKTIYVINVRKAKQQVIDYKIFCALRGICPNNANSLALYFKQAKAGA